MKVFLVSYIDSVLVSGEVLPIQVAQGRYLMIPEVLSGDVLVLRGAPIYWNLVLAADNTWKKGSTSFS